MSDLRSQIVAALEFAQQQIRRRIDKPDHPLPLFTTQGRWAFDASAPVHGADGLLAGMMLLILDSGVADDAVFWLQQVDRACRAVVPLTESRDAHDLGLGFYLGGPRLWYQRSIREGEPDRSSEQTLVRAGQVLALRFEFAGQYFRSPVGPESVWLTSLLNVPLIFFTAEHMDPKDTSPEGLNAHELKRRALQHVLTLIRALGRGDGSFAEAGLFDTRTGEFLRHDVHHGYRNDSSHARSQASALYGLATCYELTRDRRLLLAAERSAEFWLTSVPMHGVPPWDLEAPMGGQFSLLQPDSSAAAIAASGLLLLARHTPDRIRAQAYEQQALNTLQTLTKPPYLAIDDPTCEGILRRGVWNVRQGIGVDASTTWGDFFVLEAMARAMDLL